MQVLKRLLTTVQKGQYLEAMQHVSACTTQCIAGVVQWQPDNLSLRHPWVCYRRCRALECHLEECAENHLFKVPCKFTHATVRYMSTALATNDMFLKNQTCYVDALPRHAQHCSQRDGSAKVHFSSRMTHSCMDTYWQCLRGKSVMMPCSLLDHAIAVQAALT